MSKREDVFSFEKTPLLEASKKMLVSKRGVFSKIALNGL